MSLSSRQRAVHILRTCPLTKWREPREGLPCRNCCFSSHQGLIPYCFYYRNYFYFQIYVCLPISSRHSNAIFFIYQLSSISPLSTYGSSLAWWSYLSGSSQTHLSRDLRKASRTDWLESIINVAKQLQLEEGSQNYLMAMELGSLKPTRISIINAFFFQTPQSSTLLRAYRAAILILDFLLTRGSRTALARGSVKLSSIQPPCLQKRVRVQQAFF